MTAPPDRLDSYRRGIGDCIRVTEAIGRIIATDPEITAGLAELENVNPADAIADALDFSAADSAGWLPGSFDRLHAALAAVVTEDGGPSPVNRAYEAVRSLNATIEKYLGAIREDDNRVTKCLPCPDE